MNTQEIYNDNQRLRKALQKIVEAGELWGSEGKQHHEALYIARCALALTDHNEPKKLYRQATMLDARLRNAIWEKGLRGRRAANLLQMSAERIKRRAVRLKQKAT